MSLGYKKVPGLELIYGYVLDLDTGSEDQIQVCQGNGELFPTETQKT